jgi:hypothetical protein
MALDAAANPEAAQALIKKHRDLVISAKRLLVKAAAMLREPSGGGGKKKKEQSEKVGSGTVPAQAATAGA